MYNARVYEVADIIDTYVYRVGLVDLRFSFSAAVGFFKSVVSLILVLVVNAVARRAGDGEYSLW